MDEIVAALKKSEHGALSYDELSELVDANKILNALRYLPNANVKIETISWGDYGAPRTIIFMLPDVVLGCLS